MLSDLFGGVVYSRICPCDMCKGKCVWDAMRRCPKFQKWFAGEWTDLQEYLGETEQYKNVIIKEKINEQ